jgi:hypothetical protein
MSLSLGKTFDRNYNIRLPFLDGYYDIGTFFNKRSPFLLFRIDSDFTNNIAPHGVKINMFKNLESSKFCETFLNLHNFRKSTLDIINQFEGIKPDYYYDINFILNETLRLSKVEVGDKTLFDILTIYGFTLTIYNNEFIFIIAERQNIIKKLGKKVVRTTGVQISTSRALNILNEFHDESIVSGKEGLTSRPVIPSDEKEIITLSEVDEDNSIK